MTSLRKIVGLIGLALVAMGGSAYAQTKPMPYNTGTIASTGQAVILTTDGSYNTAGILVNGTWSGSLLIYGSVDCTTYSVTSVLPLASGIASAAISANGNYQANLAGLKCLKIYGTSIISGSATVSLLAGVGVGPIMQDNAPWIIGGFSTGSSSTGISATVKAANTAPTANDTPLVVAASPNVAGLTPVVSASAESSHVLKASAGTLFSVYATTGATAGYLMIDNATSAPGDGAVTPLQCVYIPAYSTGGLTFNSGPVETYSTGITAVFSSTGCFTQTASATAFFHGVVK